MNVALKERKDLEIEQDKGVGSSNLLCENPIMNTGDLVLRLTIFYNDEWHAGDCLIKKQDIILCPLSKDRKDYNEFLVFVNNEVRKIASIIRSNLIRILGKNDII